MEKLRRKKTQTELKKLANELCSSINGRKGSKRLPEDIVKDFHGNDLNQLKNFYPPDKLKVILDYLSCRFIDSISELDYEKEDESEKIYDLYNSLPNILGQHVLGCMVNGDYKDIASFILAYQIYTLPLQGQYEVFLGIHSMKLKNAVVSGDKDGIEAETEKIAHYSQLLKEIKIKKEKEASERKARIEAQRLRAIEIEKERKIKEARDRINNLTRRFTQEIKYVFKDFDLDTSLLKEDVNESKSQISRLLDDFLLNDEEE